MHDLRSTKLCRDLEIRTRSKVEQDRGNTMNRHRAGINMTMLRKLGKGVAVRRGNQA